MKNILDILNEIYSSTKEINLKELPSQGLFYPCDFKLFIQKALIEDIDVYNNTIKDNLIDNYNATHYMVRKCVVIENYTFEDIKSNDMYYLLFEISKFTMNRDIVINFYDRVNRESFDLKFGKETFHYFNYKKIGATYNKETRELERDGYKFVLPSYGVEICLIDYMQNIDHSEYNSDFIFFTGNKRLLTKEEILNLKIIFNDELDDVEINKLKNIVNDFKELISYALNYNGKKYYLVDEGECKINFERLFI
jgi:hypothetical protein